ncbi:MAG: tRNA preQ1(34) S-adenosylmethionine ribosyltransferase-isomerase QueA [Eubacteriales bacterium]
MDKSSDIYSLSHYDYDLPEELIAQSPYERRDMSRLLVYERESGQIEHRLFKDITEYLREGDVLVLNDSRVIPARLYGEKDSGAKVEFVLLERLQGDVWEVMTRPGKKTQIGTTFSFGDGSLSCRIVDRTPDGNRLAEFSYKGSFFEILDKIGSLPLPPYIKRTPDESDKDRYQTVYARENGSAAAPTAGLHFTAELLEILRAKGVKIAPVLLHVGLGTFRLVKTDNILEHKMHSEYYSMPQESANIINAARKKGGKIFAVGTTSCRTLETAADNEGTVHPGHGHTDIFIYPGYKFKAVDALITNFHLPKSTLMMLVSAFAGRNNILNIYAEAVEEKYRFFSFGDAMLLL